MFIKVFNFVIWGTISTAILYAMAAYTLHVIKCGVLCWHVILIPR